MTQQDKDREAFESFVRRGTREGEDFLERDTKGIYLLSVAVGGWASWQAARDHYTPKLTEEAVKRAAMAIAVEYSERDYSKDTNVSPYEDSGLFAAENWKEFENEAAAALRAAGVRFKEEHE